MTLEETRKSISQQFIGKYGIHGVGANAKTNVVNIYTSKPLGNAELEIKKAADPYGLNVEIHQMPIIGLPPAFRGNKK